MYSTSWAHVASLAAIVCFAAGVSWCVVSFRRWLCRKQAYIAGISECGALPPTPTPAALRRFKRFLRVILFIQVGKVRFQGLHNAHIRGPKLITPNHGSSMDLAVLLAFEEPVRSMAAQAVFTFAKGLGALIFGSGGAFPVDLRPGKGRPAFNTAVDVVASGQPLLIFPEGWAYMDGGIGAFKTGAVRIAKQAAARCGTPVYILPTYMRYGRYPGKWILRYPPPVQYLFAFLLFFRYRRGLTVVFGEPISSEVLAEDEVFATAALRAAILAADPAHREEISATVALNHVRSNV